MTEEKHTHIPDKLIFMVLIALIAVVGFWVMFTRGMLTKSKASEGTGTGNCTKPSCTGVGRERVCVTRNVPCDDYYDWVKYGNSQAAQDIRNAQTAAKEKADKQEKANSNNQQRTCFVGGTNILMATGNEKNIEDIAVGDSILTRENETSSNLVSTHITQTFKHIANLYLSINNGYLKVTPEHVVYLNGTWKGIGSAKIGDKLIDKTGKEVAITSIEVVNEKVNVYNLTTDTYHTYFANGLYVHNKKTE